MEWPCWRGLSVRLTLLTTRNTVDTGSYTSEGLKKDARAHTHTHKHKHKHLSSNGSREEERESRDE
jgi:hypothetical protein